MEKVIPAAIVKEIFHEWVKNYGATFPLYGNNTVRHDISGSVRPLLSSTEIPHSKILAERSGISKKTIQRILEDPELMLTFEQADTLLCCMDHEWKWFQEPLLSYYNAH